MIMEMMESRKQPQNRRRITTTMKNTIGTPYFILGSFLIGLLHLGGIEGQLRKPPTIKRIQKMESKTHGETLQK